MFDLIIKEVASRFGLGDKAAPLVQMLVAFMTNKDTGGLSGFINLFKSKGMGDLVSSWMGGSAAPLGINHAQIENVFGGKGGMLETVLGKTGLSSGTALSALSFLLPSLLGKLTPGGSVPTSLSSEISSFAEKGSGLLGGLLGAGAAAATAATGAAAGAAAAGAKAVGNAGHAATAAAGIATGAAANAGKAASGGLMKFLPWVIAAAIALWLLKTCTGGDAMDAAKKTADAAKATATATADATKATAGAAVDAAKSTATAAVDATKAAADAASTAAASTVATAATGAAAALSYLDKLPEIVGGAPVTKIYFASGKIDVPADTAEKIKPIIEYVKANAGTKAALSGFHDPTGDKAQNEELAKNRAKMVREMVRSAGLMEDQILMAKPEQTAGSGDNQEARRVEVTVRK
jgi:uncharacterized protein YidB (DUF937 family)/outer membrane protein OmpA-like peptidoglycan-associated protein